MSRVLIIIEGGLVAEVHSDDPHLEMTVFDEDVLQTGDRQELKDYLAARSEDATVDNGTVSVNKDRYPHVVYGA